MSSQETSGAPAEGTATTPAPEAAFPSFGTTRGSGLARGKRPAAASSAASSAPAADYKPTAIEVVTAPREYQNPFAPAETPAAVAPEIVATPVAEPAAVAPVAPVIVETPVAPVVSEPAPTPAAAPQPSPAPVAAVNEEPATLNILEPLKTKSIPAQTWESEGFRPAREPRGDRPRREAREEAPAEPVDISTIPAKFLYVRPGHTYVPTPTNWGGAPRERASRSEGTAATGAPSPAPRSSEAPKRPVAASEPAKPASGGGFFGWLKGLFGGAPEPVEAAPARSSYGEQRSPAGQQSRNRPQGGGEGQRRRHRGGRGRGKGRGGEGGSSAT